MRNALIKDILVPKIGLGTFELNGEACVQAISDAAEIGYRHFDTAARYGNEESVGRGLAQTGLLRDEYFVTTKVWITDLDQDSITRTVGASLERLGLEQVDLLLLHWPSPEYTVQYAIESLEIVKAAGLTRQVGVSNFPPSLLREALSYGDLFCNQVEYHPYLSQDMNLALAQQHDLLITGYAPLALGRVSTDPELVTIGQRHGKTAAQIALRWLIEHPNVAAIPKSRSRERLSENFDVWDFALSDEERRSIGALAEGYRIYDEEWVVDWEDGSTAPRRAIRSVTLPRPGSDEEGTTVSS